MKTIIILVALMVTTGSLFASEPELKFPDNIVKHVNSINSYPASAVQLNIEGYVDVVFEVNENGRIIVYEYFGTDQLLSDHVLKGLSEVRMCPFDLSVGKKYKVRYNFSLL